MSRIVWCPCLAEGSPRVVWKLGFRPTAERLLRARSFRGLQYGFGSAESAKQWLLNATSSLRVGGVFVGIIPDANVIVKRL